MKINGAHAIIYSKNAEADRALLKDVFQFKHVDVGGGWLIFGLPPAEVAVHPSEENDQHELYLMTDDIEGFVAEMKKRQIPCAAPEDQGWGVLTHITVPGGGKLGVYAPRHVRPPSGPRAYTLGQTDVEGDAVARSKVLSFEFNLDVKVDGVAA